MATLIVKGLCRPTTSSRLVPYMNYATEKKSSWKFPWSQETAQEEAETEKQVEERKRYIREIEKDSREEYIQSRRNKSRLTASHRQIINGKPPYEGLVFEYEDKHRSKDFKRKMLARYGVRSGVDPAISWPTDEELELAKVGDLTYYSSL